MKKADFLYPRYSYHGEVRPKNIILIPLPAKIFHTGQLYLRTGDKRKII